MINLKKRINGEIQYLDPNCQKINKFMVSSNKHMKHKTLSLKGKTKIYIQVLNVVKQFRTI